MVRILLYIDYVSIFFFIYSFCSFSILFFAFIGLFQTFFTFNVSSHGFFHFALLRPISGPFFINQRSPRGIPRRAAPTWRAAAGSPGTRKAASTTLPLARPVLLRLSAFHGAAPGGIGPLQRPADCWRRVRSARRAPQARGWPPGRRPRIGFASRTHIRLRLRRSGEVCGN